MAPPSDTQPTVPGDGLPPRFDPAELERSLVGKTIGGFRIKKRLGGGGMGEVYLAEQDLGAGTKLVALKTVLTRYMGQEEAIKRFQEEAFAAGTMKTNYVAQVMSYGMLEATRELPPLHYLVMEYATAGTLTNYMQSFPDQRLPVDEGIRLLRQAAEGFLAAERRVDSEGKADPLVHRDIKPANLLLQQDATGQVDIRIADFGAVKRLGRTETEAAGSELSQMGAPMTPGYASPEQWNWDAVDHRSDMYSLGATFFHAISGQRATPETANNGLIRKFVLQTPCLSLKSVMNDVPEALNRVIERMTALEVDKRYDSFADVVKELEVFQQKAVSLKRVWLTLALAVAVLTALVFMIGPSQTYKAKDLHGEFVALETQIAAALKGSDQLAELDTVKAEFESILQKVGQQARELQREIDENGPDAVVGQDPYEKRVLLQDEFSTWRGKLAASVPALAGLKQLEADYQGLARDEAERILAGIPAEVVRCLAVRKKALAERIATLHAARTKRLRTLERDFHASAAVLAVGQDAKDGFFADLRQQIGAFRQDIPASEVTMVDEAAVLLQTMDGAERLAAGLPVWPNTAVAAPAEQLQGLCEALRGIAALPVPDGALLMQWWRSRRDAMAGSWRSPLQQQLRAAVADYKARESALQRMPYEGARPLYPALQDHYQELRGRIVSVRAALQNSEVFPTTDWAMVNDELFTLGPAPQLGFDREALTAEYRHSEGLAKKFATQTGTPEATKLAAAAEGAIAYLAQSTQPRISDFDGHDQPRQLVEKLALVVNNYIEARRQDLRRGEVELQEMLAVLEVLADEAEGWPQSCQERASKLAQVVRQALALKNMEPPPAPAGASLQLQVVAFAKAVEYVARISQSHDTDPDLQAWRMSWTRSRFQELVRPLKAQIPRAGQDLRSTIAKLREAAIDLEKVDPASGRDLLDAITNALLLLDGGALPMKPESWSEAAWEHWAHPLAAPAGLQAEWRDPVLVCWFPFRQRVVDLAQDKKEPVEMVLVAAPGVRRFLVDRHEVCVGELLALGVSVGGVDPGGYLTWRAKSHWPYIRGTPDALLSWTSQEMATSFAVRAYAAHNLGFELPTVAQWDALVAGAEKRENEVVGDPSKVRINRADEVRGVFGLRSGLAEWRRDVSFAGNTDYEHASLQGPFKPPDWVKGVGFRCVITLE